MQETSNLLGIEEQVLYTQLNKILDTLAGFIDANFHLIPGNRKLINLLVESVSRGQQWQHLAAIGFILGEQGDPAALGKAAGPAADGRQCESTVWLQLADDGADRVEVVGHRAGYPRLFARYARNDGATSGELEIDLELGKLGAHIMGKLVGKTGRAGNRQHLQ